MKISFECPDKINGLLSLTVEESDYKDTVEKKLKDFRRRANVPGFRPGQVPMAMIKRQYETPVKVEEINKFVGENIYKYVRENNIMMLGEPLPNEKQVPQDLEKDKEFQFYFDIAVAPEFEISLSDKDKIEYPAVKIDDKMIDDRVNMFASRAGKQEQVEEYKDDDMLKGDVRELDADGNAKEGGIVSEGAVLMPKYIKGEDQKKLFENAKKGDIITFNPKKAFPESEVEVSSLLKIKKEEVKDLESDFTFQVNEISRFVPAEVNQDLFDQVFGPGNVKDEADFRQKIGESLKRDFVFESDYRFLRKVREYCEKKVGDLTFPNDLLKRVMIAGNKDKDEKFVDENFDKSIQELKWHLIKEQLVKQTGIKVENEDIKAAARDMARYQYAQYGLNNIPDEYLDNYADKLLEDKNTVDRLVDSVIDRKLTLALKDTVKPQVKEMSLEDFNKDAGEEV